MKLTADEKGSLTNAELFRPNATFEAQREPDGSVRVVEIKDIPVVRPRRINGRLRGAEVPLSRQAVAAAVRADREEQ